MEDNRAIEKLIKGDLSGLEELVRNYQEKAVRVVTLIVLDEPSAEDIVVETFLRIASNIRSFNKQQPFEPYLMRSLINAALNAARDRRKFADLDDGEEKLGTLLKTAETLEDSMIAEELRKEIWDAVASLSPRQRAAVVQRYYLDLSEAEMSVALEAPKGTVKWLLHRARHNLEKRINKERI